MNAVPVASSERGSGPLDTIIATVGIVVLLMLGVQVALVYHGLSVEQSIAQAAARTAQQYGSSPAQGTSAANALMTTYGGVFVNWSVSQQVLPAFPGSHTTLSGASYTIRGQVVSVFPGVHLTIAAQSGSTSEQFQWSVN